MSQTATHDPRKRPDPALPDVRMHLHTPAEPARGIVVSTRRCTASNKSAAFVRHVEIDVSGSKLASAWRSGQSFGVIPPGTDHAGKPHKLRLYSIAAPTAGEDGNGSIISTTVKRTIDEHHDTHKLFLGVCSNYLCDLQVGDAVTLTGPSGKRFLLPAEHAAHDYLFLATGTGIAPFRGMLMDLAASGALATSRVVLVMGTPYATDLLYHDQLNALQQQFPNFTYLTAISREAQTDGHGPLYVQERLHTHRHLIEPLLASPRGLVYICGLAGMELGILKRLVDVLPADALDQYLQAPAHVLDDRANWTRSMLHKDIRLTRRVFLEVYD